MAKTPRGKLCAMHNGTHVHLARSTGITRELYGETHEMLKVRRDRTVSTACMWDSKCKANFGGKPQGNHERTHGLSKSERKVKSQEKRKTENGRKSTWNQEKTCRVIC